MKLTDGKYFLLLRKGWLRLCLSEKDFLCWILFWNWIGTHFWPLMNSEYFNMLLNNFYKFSYLYLSINAILHINFKILNLASKEAIIIQVQVNLSIASNYLMEFILKGYSSYPGTDTVWGRFYSFWVRIKQFFTYLGPLFPLPYQETKIRF